MRERRNGSECQWVQFDENIHKTHRTKLGLYRIIPDQTIGQKSEHSHVSTLTKQLITFSTSMIYKTITFTQSQRNSAVTTCAIWLSVCMSHSKIRWCVRVITEFNSIENHPLKSPVWKLNRKRCTIKSNRHGYGSTFGLVAEKVFAALHLPQFWHKSFNQKIISEIFWHKAES